MKKDWNTIVYVTRDIERALGKVPSDTYHIVTNLTSYAETIARVYPNHVHLVSTTSGSTEDIMSTDELLQHPTTTSLVKRLGARVIVFKNFPLIETIASEHNLNLLNPPAALAEKVENKIAQVQWLGKIGERYLPPHHIAQVSDIHLKKEPLILQWAHSHSGEGTLLVHTTHELDTLKDKFPDRQARVSTYIKGPTFTINSVVTNDAILGGNISCQITGIPPFTDRPFTTIGNDWSITRSLLSQDHVDEINDIAQAVGEKLQKDGWRGLFGIDVMRDEELDKLFLIEINARQPASTTYESILQENNRTQGMTGHTVFEAHLNALLGIPTTLPLVEINDGAQIVQRITKKTHTIATRTLETLIHAGYTPILYKNTEPNSDLLRIQSAMGIMESHTKLNKRGKEIMEICHPHNV